ncbi:hypothetical protein EBR21_05870 [bacterium]|nr:hypothetical protein [bacterium]
MPRKTSESTRSRKASSGGSPAEIYRQMEELQKEILILAKRAEDEMESLLRLHPEPIVSMLKTFASRVKATDALICLDLQQRKFVPLLGLNVIQMMEADRFQCDVALSGREMAMDFSRGRIYLPVVVFENPVAVAMFTVPKLGSGNYESVCAAATEGICRLRSELKMTHVSESVDEAAS